MIELRNFKVFNPEQKVMNVSDCGELEEYISNYLPSMLMQKFNVTCAIRIKLKKNE